MAQGWGTMAQKSREMDTSGVGYECNGVLVSPPIHTRPDRVSSQPKPVSASGTARGRV